MSDHLTYAQVADRIEATLGERPALSALRSAATRRSAGVSGGTLLTAGMPLPTAGPPGHPSFFVAADVDTWLAHHPRRAWQTLLEVLASATAADRPQAVAAARDAGISWQRIVNTINAADGTHRSRQWAQQRYAKATS